MPATPSDHDQQYREPNEVGKQLGLRTEGIRPPNYTAVLKALLSSRILESPGRSDHLQPAQREGTGRCA